MSGSRPSPRGFRMRSASGATLRNDEIRRTVIPDGRAALGAGEPEPTRRFAVGN